jgi:hypothetical protein
MMKRTSLALLSLLALTAPAQALKLVVWDPELKSKVAYGETSGGRFNVKYDKDYSGPVVALFSQSEDEKAKGTYSGLRSSYAGVLRGGQLLIDNEASTSARSSTNLLPLPRLLQPYKLSVNIQPTSLLLPLSNTLLVQADGSWCAAGGAGTLG